MKKTMKINRKKFVGGKQASEIIGVHQRTLYQWDDKGLIETIRTPGGKRLYNVEKYLEENKDEQIDQIDPIEQIDKIKGKLSICYVRVSSQGQKDDLERQKAMMIENYPTHLIIEDIGSGLNLNKRGIKKIIHLAIEGRIKEIVVAYKDRLTRFGYELIEELVTKYSEGEIKVLNEKELIEPEEELVKDMMSIMNVYVAKMNGLRKYRKKTNEI
jgi:predicted site-specific integrase-resolvase